MHLNKVHVFPALFFIILVSACVQTIIPLTVDELVRNETRLLNQSISVEGVAGIGQLRCTLIACENECCNSCGGSLSIGGTEGSSIEVRGQYEGRGVGCSGNECKQDCYPLEKDKKYILTGIIKESYGELYIELKSFREVG